MAARDRSFLSVHYGWVNVALAALAMTATLPGRSHGIGLITSPLLADLHVSDPEFALLNFWAVIVGSVMALPTTWLIDRLGTRIIAAAVLLGLGSAVIAMSAVDRSWLFPTLLLVRGLGQSALSVVAIAIVGKWYGRRLGVAMGAFALLLSIGMIAATVITSEAIEALGWRIVWQRLGYFVLALAPLTALFVRSLPPGDPTDAGAVEPSSAADASLGHALATPAFWIYSLASAFFLLVYSSVTLYAQTLLDAQELRGRETFTSVMATLTAAGLFANLVGGWLATRWPLGRLLGVSMILLAIALVAFPMIRTPAGATAYGLALGGSGGLITVVYFAFYGRAYGRRHLGRIQGVAQVLTVVGSALGPLLLTESKVATGSYHAFFWLAAATFVVLAVPAWLVRVPRAALPAASA